MYKQIFLKRGKEESLKRFHPWIFSGAIHHMDEGIEEGETVRVITAAGEFIAVGHYQIGSIAVRVLSFEDIEINTDFWCERLQSALDVRIGVGIADSPTNNTYRLVHGEGDYLPGLVIDCYGSTAVMQAHSVGMHVCRNEICQALVQVMGDRIANVYYKSETTLPYKADLHQENGFLVGGDASNVAMENGLKFHIDWLRGQKTGFFVDQRENRSLLEQYAKGKSVLNMFCYTGGFSVYAMRGDAKQVHSVDSSAKAIELTNDNVALNFPGDARHEAFCEDAFKYLDEHDQQYDLIVLDPPAFAKHRAALRNALKGYTRLNVKGLQRIKKGGILFTFSCSQVVTKDNFRNAVFTAAAQVGRKVRILHQLHQPADHPINIYHPEGEYLKGLVLYVE
ncbi:class I SAM-dependent rRNA methyltransferase [Prevotella copri]|jgi:23S rRNA (cytosine1962-C5)-methyltransferase|uniref:Class I SAM-dependent rRNA methyltransferase n=1 Tax=Segatella copri TaxID=165179 RepID=A0A6A7WE84_9BACT|nr:class I SAM-dependent rRNA methyltransferase [Segatella copri]MBD9072716.1 class I SAM-dependent rRNA methyltransferase [Prevotella sp.]MBD9260351.1 class I SAM-dependent rRNA methyltransferase [Prevotella sp.]MBP8641906.1 class I SAM-dependent rRNA methyltransferase [Prevotella sp.]MBV3414477.1 class I SAM-dependent rRNA methyltransferase [Segatella copri]MDD6529657.1 class I SAM-dependent rRNA methyltransferase [Segatella copri]